MPAPRDEPASCKAHVSSLRSYLCLPGCKVVFSAIRCVHLGCVNYGVRDSQSQDGLNENHDSKRNSVQRKNLCTIFYPKNLMLRRSKLQIYLVGFSSTDSRAFRVWGLYIWFIGMRVKYILEKFSLSFAWGYRWSTWARCTVIYNIHAQTAA